jgi:hypothetical protein
MHPRITLNICRQNGVKTATRLKCGPDEGVYRVYDEAGHFLMLGRIQGGVMKTLKSFFEVDQ